MIYSNSAPLLEESRYSEFKYLDALNYTDGSEGSFPEGDGLCENLRAPNDVDWEELAGTKAPPSMDID